MASTFAEIVGTSRKSTGKDLKWLGSDRHRRVLERSLPDVFGITDASVVWGASSSWRFDTREITLARPTVLDGQKPKDIAEFTAITLLHETLHARYSEQLGLFAERHADLPNLVGDAAHLIFQRLEDARITALGLASAPELAEPLEKFAAETVRQFKMHYAGRGNGNTVTPRSQQSQLLFAFEMYSIHPSEPLKLHPQVQSRFDALKGKVDEARVGSSEDCDRVSVELSRAVAAMPE